MMWLKRVESYGREGAHGKPGAFGAFPVDSEGMIWCLHRYQFPLHQFRVAFSRYRGKKGKIFFDPARSRGNLQSYENP